jgi:hypothetical protein
VVAKVKAAERDRDGLEGAKTVAEAYLGKERECALAHASLYHHTDIGGSSLQP